MNKTHNEFMEEVVEESREPTLAEQTCDALSQSKTKKEAIGNQPDALDNHDANYNETELNK